MMSLAWGVKQSFRAYVAMTGGDGIVRIWDREVTKEAGAPLRHLSPVTVLDFSSDDRRLLTSTADTFRVWDVTTGVPLTRSHPTYVGNGGQLFGEPAQRLVAQDRVGLGRIFELVELSSLDSGVLAQLAENVAGLRYEKERFTSLTQPMDVTAPERQVQLARLIACFQSGDASRRLTPFTDTTLEQFVAERLEAAGNDPAAVARQLALVYPGSVPVR